MCNPQTNLIGKKQIVIIGSAGLVGISFHLYRQHYENGTLTTVDYFSAGATVIIFALIVAFVTRKGNKE